MKRERNDKDIRKNVINNLSDEVIDVDENNMFGDEDTSLKEWDFTDDEEIQEFLSHDFDVVAESRRRLQNSQNRARRGRTDKAGNDSKTAREKEIKEKAAKEKRPKNEDKNKVRAGNAVPIINKLNGLWDKWLEIYHKNTMQILFGTLTLLMAVLVVAIVATYPYGDDEGIDVPSETTTASEETTTSVEETTTAEKEPEILPETEDSAIHNLVKSYIDAAYIKADMEAVALVVDDTTNINVDSYKSRQKYIESYENISCYKLESAIENAYIVFVTYEAKLYNINTLVPSAETFIAKYDTTAGKFYIHNMTESEKLDGYVAKGSQFEIINKMSAEVLGRLEAALASDSDLKEVYDLMNNISSQATQSSDESAPEQSSGAEETTTAAAQ